MIVAAIIFWLCTYALLHSYIVYPLLVKVLVSIKKAKWEVNPYEEDELPQVFVLMAAYNEATVIEQTINELLASDYPTNKLTIHIGSDCSTDGTDAILQRLAQSYNQLKITLNTDRKGKIRIINELFDDIKPGKDDLLLLVDANISFRPDTIRQIANVFTDKKVGLVAGNILNSGLRKDGISIHEQTYIQGENQLKFNEGILWGTMMGAFGACYAVRAGLYTKVPTHHKVDDFYVTLKVLEQGYKAVLAPDAIAYEDVSNEIKEEFRRKARIATGNYQNLRVLSHLLWPPYYPLSFAFLSHKVLRWLGPFFLIACYVSNLWLWSVNDLYKGTFLVQNLLLTLPVIELVFQKVGLHLIPLRFVTYFYYMNAGLLVGFVNYLKGDTENVWEPTKRNQ